MARGFANRLRPGETVEVGDQVLVSLAGSGSSGSGSRDSGPRLFQIVEVRNGKIVRMQDYATPEEALAAAGLTT